MLMLKENEEYKLFHKNIKLCFIISTGRTGTKFLANFLNEYKEIMALHEPKPDFLELGNEFLNNKILFSTALKIIYFNRKDIIRQASDSNARLYVESNNRLYSLIPVLKELYQDDMKIIHVVRDGRDVVRSGMSRPWYEPNDPFPRIKATDFPDDPYFEKWGDMNKFEKICWWWQKKDGIIYKHLKEFGNHITVKFEDIFNHNENYPGLKEILNFLGLHTQIDSSALRKKANSTNSFVLPQWTDWDENLKNKFSDIAGECMERNGYIF